MQQNRKFVLAFLAYAALGLGVWLTVDDLPVRLFNGVVIKLRSLTLVILGAFVLKSFLFWLRCRLEANDERRRNGETAS